MNWQLTIEEKLESLTPTRPPNGLRNRTLDQLAAAMPPRIHFLDRLWFSQSMRLGASLTFATCVTILLLDGSPLPPEAHPSSLAVANYIDFETRNGRIRREVGASKDLFTAGPLFGQFDHRTDWDLYQNRVQMFRATEDLLDG